MCIHYIIMVCLSVGEEQAAGGDRGAEPDEGHDGELGVLTTLSTARPDQSQGAILQDGAELHRTPDRTVKEKGKAN
jgi:hypothetical protein